VHVDMLERPISAGDYVTYYSNIYQVLELLGSSTGAGARLGTGSARIRLLDKSKTTKSVKKNCHEMCIIDTEDVLLWKIKRGY
jgi:hypothetical protein